MLIIWIIIIWIIMDTISDRSIMLPKKIYNPSSQFMPFWHEFIYWGKWFDTIFVEEVLTACSENEAQFWDYTHLHSERADQISQHTHNESDGLELFNILLMNFHVQIIFIGVFYLIITPKHEIIYSIYFNCKLILYF